MNEVLTIEEFVEKYKSFVFDWFRIRDRKNITHVDEEEFWSELTSKILRKDLLEIYDPSKAKFETWLKKIMNNLYIDMSMSIASRNWVPIYTTDDDKNFKILEERFVVDRDEGDILKLDEDDRVYINQLIEKIPKICNRILMKLKTYVDGSTVLYDEEYSFLESKCDITNVKGFIRDKIYNHKAGMKDKDIAFLLDMKPGTVNTTYQRDVRKYVKEPYLIYKAKNVKD